MKYHAFIGRWQSPHKGHRWLIDKWLAKGEPVLILIRDVKQDEKNPFTADEVELILSACFDKEIAEGLVALQVIPDIASVNYGRGVGYDIIEHEPPTHIERVSATEIRAKMAAGDESWKNLVMPGAAEAIEQVLQDRKALEDQTCNDDCPCNHSCDRPAMPW